MYARSYYPEASDRLNIPENYDGTAFTDRQDNHMDEQSDHEAKSHSNNEETLEVGLGRVPILSSLFGKGGCLPAFSFKLSDIGTEEILIIAAAAFLFFSKDGDKESALILLILLLIK